MKCSSLIIYGLLISLLLAGPVAAQCLEYEPKVVSLSGTLVRETLPGRPNYESVASGDAPETIWVLKLKAPICMLAANDIDVSENSETEIQLVLDQGQYNKYRNLNGHSVTITGKLFHSHTGHHHKRLLLTTNEITDPAGK
jgi:hypothetical protein